MTATFLPGADAQPFAGRMTVVHTLLHSQFRLYWPSCYDRVARQRLCHPCTIRGIQSPRPANNPCEFSNNAATRFAESVVMLLLIWLETSSPVRPFAMVLLRLYGSTPISDSIPTASKNCEVTICRLSRACMQIVPWFQPMIREYQNGHWYLGEDFSFCERARQAGFSICADSSIRLWHYGNYAFGWEEAGNDVKRFETFNFQINSGAISS